MRKVNIGLVGCGTVGSGVVQGLARNGSLMGSRLGVKLSLAGVAVRSCRSSAAGSAIPVGLWQMNTKAAIDLMQGVRSKEQPRRNSKTYSSPILSYAS